MTRNLITIVVVTALSLSACGDDDTDDTDDTSGADVTITNFEFDPPTLEVSAGSTVDWANDDGVAHTVTAGSPGSASGEFDETLDAGSSAEITLEDVGTVDYFCAIHPAMTGQVVVS